MIVFVTQEVGETEVELAVVMGADGEVSRVDWADGRHEPLPELDWDELADEAVLAMDAKLRFWP